MTESNDRQATVALSTEDVLADLSPDGPVRLQPGERLWKLYIIRPSAGRTTRLEHRIYSKLKAGGGLAMVTFVAHRPNGGPTVRSGVAHVTDLSLEHLKRIIDSIRRQSVGREDEYVELDLSHLPTLTEQLEHLSRL